MFVILKESATDGKNLPIFYSEGLYQAKRDLVKYVKEEYDCPKIFAFNYDLSEFNSERTILRYGDDKERSIQVIEVRIIEQYGFSYVLGYENEQSTEITDTFRIYEVHKAQPEPEPVVTETQLPSLPMPDYRSGTSFDPMDAMMRELLRKRKRVDPVPFDDFMFEDQFGDYYE